MRDEFLPDLRSIVIFVSLLILTIVLAFVFRKVFNRLIQRSTSDIKNDPTNYIFIKHAITGIIYFVGFAWAVYTWEPLKAIANSMLAGAGILAVAIGFASQQALSNIISGLFLILFKPYRVNDIVQIQDNLRGSVEDITLRHTVIRDFQNRRIIVPNSIISNEVILNSNIGDVRICKFIEIGVAYDTDLTLAKQIIREEIINHPLHIDGRTDEQIENGAEEVPIRLVELGDFAITLRAYAWANGPQDSYVMTGDVLESVKNRFDKERVEIPFPYRTIVYKKDLQGKSDAEKMKGSE